MRGAASLLMLRRLRMRLLPALALPAGLRAACAVVAPLVIGELLAGRPWSWAALGAWLTTLSDPGGAYRNRSRTMGAAALLGTLSGLVATLAGGSPPVAVLLTFVWAFASVASRLVLPATAGTTALFFLALTLPYPAAGAAALARAAELLAGGAWALALSLFLWPLRPYQPARRAVAGALRAVAGLAGAMAGLARQRAPEAAWAAEIAARQRSLRVALETAHSTATLTNRGAAGGGWGTALERLAMIADHVFGELLALAADLETGRGDPSAPGALEWIESELGRLAGAVASEAVPPAPPEVPFPGRTRVARDLLLDARERAAIFREDNRTIASPTLELPRGGSDHLARLRVGLRPGSLVFDHALRVALAAAASVLLASLLKVPHGQWVTLTVVAVLQPFAGGTLERASLRVSGTIAGAVLGAVIAMAARGQFLAEAALFPLALTAVAFRPVSYGLFTFFVTPVVVLLTGLGHGGWDIAIDRVIDTLAGGALAVAAGVVLWPRSERQELPDVLAASLDANHEFLGRIARRDRPENVLQARRRVGLANNDSDAAVARVRDRPWGPRSPLDLEAAAMIVLLSRRIATTLTALAASADEDLPDLSWAGASLAAAALALRERRVPVEPPPAPSVLASGVAGAQAERLALYLGDVYEAITRSLTLAPYSSRWTLPSRRG